jgi:hypothetical protein
MILNKKISHSKKIIKDFFSPFHSFLKLIDIINFIIFVNVKTTCFLDKIAGIKLLNN